MFGRLALAVTGWLVAAVLATGVGVMVIGLFGGPLTSSVKRPMTPDEVRNALALSRDVRNAPGFPDPPGPPAPSGSTTPSDSTTPSAVRSSPGPSPGQETRFRLISTGGGHVIAGCDGGLARLRSWTPAQGFQADDVESGPDNRVRVKFESDEPEVEIEVEVRCVGGVPNARVSEHD
ncbi:hypothetical protein [Sphaerimonospora thailandensis]|uniref:Septum formation initiator n=1 Tax=Sphaerimonospora thailandensis TaxID=795644 RepID=A0A8J3RCE3_9ACTN|nr:hypothetical protein [Sphaerimonospora thailandensis]GIH73147.1 hypothetical protein Mth01_54000 [Sphaerimonospora thailandensis]